MGRSLCGQCHWPEDECKCEPAPTALYIEEHGGLEKVLQEHAALTAERDRLQAIVDRLPKTADGVVITPGTMVYDHTGEVGFRVATYGGDNGHGGCLWYATYGGIVAYEPVYSTREAAEQAKENTNESS